jgi:methionyl aminopeptidase
MNFEGVGRNDFCPCGSGLKFKKCCMGKKDVKKNATKSGEHGFYLNENLPKIYQQNYRIRLKTPAEINGIRTCGKLVMDTMFKVRDMIKPGITTNDIDRFVHSYTVDNGATPAPLNYRGFPKSVCTSINEVICHGIPSDRKLIDGDIINVDVTSILNGFYADANMTFLVGQCSQEAIDIVKAAKESLKAGLSMVKPYNTIGDIGWAIQNYAEPAGYSVVREFIGHGVGNEFHEAPDVPHFGRRGAGVPMVPNMVFTVEPMINSGRRHMKVLSDGWTAITLDGSLSAQFEQTVVVTENGYESLTPYSLDE